MRTLRALTCILLTACDDGVTTGTSPCPGGETLVDGTCRRVCGNDANCSDLGMCCINSVCGCDAACAACNPGRDSDGDGLSDAIETLFGLDPQSTDSDGDGIPDAIEFGPSADARDSDGDGIADAVETDADGDTVDDRLEAPDGLDPVDSDGDGLADYIDLDSDDDDTPDRFDNCRTTPNDQRDSDADGLGDACDPDCSGAEVCDGVDNNCNDEVDEGFPLGIECDGPDADGCPEGVSVCNVAGDGTLCNDSTGDAAEICDGIDNDCDNETDEGCACTPNDTQACGSDVGACVAGTQTCVAGGSWGACAGEVTPTPERCNGADDNCNGTDDEGCCTYAAWTLNTIETTGTTSGTGSHTTLAIDPQGGLHVAYYDGATTDLKYAYHAPWGFWSTERIDGTSSAAGEWTAMRMDDNGGEHVVYYDRTNTDLLYAYRAAGGAWTYKIVEAGSRSVGTHASLALDTAGSPHVVYFDASSGALHLRYAYMSNGNFVPQSLDEGADRVGEMSSVAVDRLGGVHIAYFNATGTNLKYLVKDPGAGAFTAPQTLDATAGAMGRHTAIAVDSDLRVHIAHIDTTTASTSVLRYGFKPAGGNWTFAPVDTIGNATSGPGDAGEFTSMVLSGGRVYISYYDAATQDLNLAYADIGSTTFTLEAIDTAGSVGQYQSLAIDAAGTLHAAYYDSTNLDLRYARKSAGGAWLTEPIETQGDTGRYPAIAADARGGVRVCFYDVTATDARCARRSEGGVWRRQMVESGTQNVGQYASIGVDGSGGVHIAYYDATGANLNLRYAYKAPAATAFTLSNIDTAADVGQFAALTIDSANAVHVAYYDNTTDDLKYARSPGGGAAFDVVLGAEAGGSAVGQYASIAAAPDGTIHIAYYEAGGAAGNNLKYIARTGTNFSTPETVDNNGNVGQYTSIAVDPANNVHIAFYDATNTELEYAYRNNGTWSKATIDSSTETDVGTHTSIVVTGGQAHIFYYDFTDRVDSFGNVILRTQDLKHAWGPAGGQVFQVETVDTRGDCGTHTAAAVDRFGALHVVYFDATRLDVQHAVRCP